MVDREVLGNMYNIDSKKVNSRAEDLFKKIISFNVLIYNKSEELYIPCEGKLLSTLPSHTGLGYKVKVEKVLDNNTPYHLKSQLLTSSYVYVKEREIEEYAKIVEEK